ncbi:MAG: molybdopterin molybdotransferase MoeA, partial [Ilumatobacteraceae bacterium]
MIPIEEARQVVLDACPVLTAQLTSYENMTGRVLAQDVVATENVPPWANSAVDGYAVRAADVTVVPCELRVIGTIAAGTASLLTLGGGEAFRIMTGAPIPSGADAVVMVEDSEKLGSDRVRLTRAAQHMGAIRGEGSDVRIGDVVFRAGSVLNAPGVGVLASINAREVLAHPRARVAVLATGDELVIDGSPLRPGQIRESNLTMLVAMIAATGCDLVDLGVIADDEALLEQTLHDVSLRCDAIVTSGGVSMGDFD